MKWFKRVLFTLSIIFIVGFVIPDPVTIPVNGATERDWNHNTFWYEPWGDSGVHKGIDIFATKATPVISASYGLVLFKGTIGIGGKVIMVLGPKWKIHYYAHLRDYKTQFASLVKPGSPLATVGTTGNAQGKPPHLHYTILSLFPRLWRWDGSSQGWKKSFILDPTRELLGK